MDTARKGEGKGRKHVADGEEPLQKRQEQMEATARKGQPREGQEQEGVTKTERGSWVEREQVAKAGQDRAGRR